MYMGLYIYIYIDGSVAILAQVCFARPRPHPFHLTATGLNICPLLSLGERSGRPTHTRCNALRTGGVDRDHSCRVELLRIAGPYHPPVQGHKNGGLFQLCGMRQKLVRSKSSECVGAEFLARCLDKRRCDREGVRNLLRLERVLLTQ